MIVVIDTHVHLYQCFDPLSALSNGARNLRAHVQSDEPFASVLILTEPHGMRCFARLRAGEIILEDCAIERLDDENAVRVSGLFTPLILVAGRQIATLEGLEALALATNETTNDGLPLDHTLRQISAAGAVPVLNWSPGKWSFGRANHVRDAINRLPVGSFLVGDSSLRPRAWPEPQLMSLAQKRGFRLIAGSDPLPFAGEERWIGSYGIVARGEFDPTHPASSLRRLLMSRESRITIAGRRRPFFSSMAPIMRLITTRRIRRITRKNRPSPGC
ncbi:MAG: hypothetical protein JXO72_02970 [Vicinamibacteria bacterium]|nr:hypothetical protein [Vicinamibacteria bacterium]